MRYMACERRGIALWTLPCCSRGTGLCRQVRELTLKKKQRVKTGEAKPYVFCDLKKRVKILACYRACILLLCLLSDFCHPSVLRTLLWQKKDKRRP